MVRAVVEEAFVRVASAKHLTRQGGTAVTYLHTCCYAQLGSAMQEA